MIGYIPTNTNDPMVKHQLTIDGVAVDWEKGCVFEDIEVGQVDLILQDSKLFHKAAELTFDDLLKQFTRVTMDYDHLWSDNFIGFHIGSVSIRRKKDKGITLYFTFSFDVEVWRNPWTMIEHQETFVNLIIESSKLDYNIENYISIGFLVDDPSVTIGSMTEAGLSVIEDIHNRTITELRAKIHSNAVVTRFDFPDEVKVPCEQYLLYFVQFLRDIGIEAIAEISEEAGKVLFSVTPTDREEALDNIRMALEIFLRLPSSPTQSSLGSIQTSVEAQRLEANILHLRSQLVLTQAQLALAVTNTQQKDMIIEQQQAVIRQQIASGEILVQSIQVTSAGNDKEPVVGDIVSIKKFDWQFVELDLPTLIRRLKQLFKP